MHQYRLAASNIGWQAQDDEAVYAALQTLGFAGLEIAPTRFVGERPYFKTEAAARKAAGLKGQYGLCIPSMQSIWFGRTENIFDARGAALLAEYTRRAVDFAAAVGCPSLVFGNPRQRRMPEGVRAKSACAGDMHAGDTHIGDTHAQGVRPEDALGFFAEISAYARQHGVVIALEANPPVYGTNFCNTSAEAFAYARRVPGLRVNYDLGTMLTNGESLDVLFENLDIVSHIHLSEPQLAPIAPRPEHRALARTLRQAGYTGFVSIEMKTQPLDTVRAVLAYTAEVFA